ncbi:hypothetical protein [Ruminococcus intestinalis]|uniref:hypothetical protein n=1 Tax=Ruminococcus intestinalis TaxID=2763066 RepID=UPI003F81A6FC
MAALVIVAADQLPIQFLVERKHSVLEMVAVHTVAALPPGQAADLPKLPCLNFNEHLTSFPVTLNKSENAVGNIITLLRAFYRSEDAYRAAREP